MSRRILLEVTEFRETRRWFRHLSGVPRTVMEIGRRLLADPDLDVQCFYYNAHAGEFYLADSALFDEGDFGADSDFGRLAQSSGTTRRALDALLRGAERAQRMRVTRGPYRHARRAWARSRGARTMAFRPDDTVVVLGAMWGSLALPDALAAARREHGFRVASLVYDTIPADYPQFYEEGFPDQYRHYLDRVLEMSERLFVISRATERSLAAYCAREGIAQPPTRVIHLGDGAVVADPAVRPANLPEGDFVLAVSTVEPRKNHEVLYRAVKHAQLAGITLPRVVVVGSPGWLTREFQFTVTSDPTTEDSFVWLSRTTDAELAWLYGNALFTVYPSIVEGWGLPIAESMSFGKPCITSGASSMPEVAGDLAEYVSPYDPAAWASSIARLSGTPDLLAEREARIRAQYVPHTWDDASRAVSEALAD